MTKPRSLARCAVLLLILLGASASGAAADTVRCGRKLAVEGDTLYDVRSRCGEPDGQTHRVELRTERAWVQGSCDGKEQTQCGRMVERTIEVVIDEWTYDFGPTQFVQHLYFEQGRLLRVVPGQRGTKKPAPAR
ncbi:MAG TPA: DUF2845 domain-containing protein [Polyangiales bacterium]